MNPFGFGDGINYAFSEPKKEVVEMAAATDEALTEEYDADSISEVSNTSRTHENTSYTGEIAQGLSKNRANSSEYTQNAITIISNDVKNSKPKKQVVEELIQSRQYTVVYTEGGKREYPDELKKQMIDDFEMVKAYDSRIKIEDFCQCIGTPSPTTFRNWLNEAKPVCPHCQEKDMEIRKLKARLSERRNTFETA